jgi:hypothetical protein
MPALPGVTWTAISLGHTSACGLRSDGGEQCWGRMAP